MYREERPYEKCEQYGAENLTDAEFTFTSTGTANVYAVYNENKKVYLTNESGANSFFSAAAKNNLSLIHI